MNPVYGVGGSLDGGEGRVIHPGREPPGVGISSKCFPRGREGINMYARVRAGFSMVPRSPIPPSPVG